jgi:outer membrane protein OmpA-like peptidoglycan-associated protein
MRIIHLGLAGIVAAWCLSMVPTYAENPALVTNPTSNDLIEALSPPPGAPPLKFRGMRLSTAKTTDRAESTPAVALDIKFEVNSATLTAPAKDVLKTLAVAMKSDQLATYQFLLEGHTDSTGTATHNMELSRSRAESVRKYLVGTLGVPASRLAASGKGQTEPLDPANPRDPANRRVQVVNLGQK